MDVYQGNDAEIKSHFFNVPANAPAVVHKVAAALKKQNDIGGFIPSFAKKDGYAIWDKSEINILTSNTNSRNGGQFDTQDTVEVFTPIVLANGNIVNGFFFSRIMGDSVALHLYRANDYDLHPYGSEDSSFVTADRVALQLAKLNFQLFKYDKFEINDSSLFKKYFRKYKNTFIRTLSFKMTSSREGNAIYCQNEVCFEIPPNNYCLYCYEVNIIVVPGEDDPPYDWPPDAPMPTGGGSGNENPSGGGNNCAAPNDCRTNSTLIAEGRIPCGGCGNGPIALPPDESPIPPLIDTCAEAMNLAKKMDTLYSKIKADSVLGTLSNWQNQTYETGYPAYKTYTQNATTGAVAVTGYYPGPMQGNSASYNVDITFTVPVGTRAAAKLHIHTSSGFAAPSAADIYAIIQDYHLSFPHSNPLLQFEGSFVAAFNNSKYAMAISNPAEALSFNQTATPNLNPFTGDWRNNSTFWNAAQHAYNFFYNRDTTLPEAQRVERAFELSQASILTYYHSGITLFKQDSTGKFKPIIVDGRLDPNNSLGRLYLQKCF